MVDQALNTLEQYDLEIKGVRKGRGNWIINCKEGDYVLKEYKGSEERACIQKALTSRIYNQTGVMVQEIVPNKEGGIFVKDYEERTYTLQTFMEGRECNIKDDRECSTAVTTMARMHKGMCITDKELIQSVVPYSLKREFAKRNTELRRIRRYLKEKRQKNEFERFLSSNYNLFFEKALEVEGAWEEYEKYCEQDDQGLQFCHGDYNHHNVWINYNEVMILQFEKYMADFPCRDLYLFLRKLLEKSNWDCRMGKEILELYEKERPLPCIERISMIYRFAYPEKFWKIANFYFNSKKSFMPEKNMEKLQRLLELEKCRENFINNTLRTII